ncbi:MAG: helix-turn-helix domain-containing protein [Anaerolineales bacterium]
MTLYFDNRPSDSPFVELIWGAYSEASGSFTSTAESHWEMVITKYLGKTTLTIRGPETQATPADYPAEAEFFGIAFKHGIHMPHLPLYLLTDRNDTTLPEATSRSFWLNGSVWEFPTFENADTFVARLVREGLLARDPVVTAVLRKEPVKLSVRTVQRRFLHVTGLTYGKLDQIERARQAVKLLEKGTSIADAIYYTGYTDQPHLTKSLKHFMGRTPAQILGKS